MKKICVDAGHHGKYNNSPVDKNYWESERMWQLSLYLIDELKRNFDVIRTRENQEEYLGLEARGKISSGGDLFLSLHSNAAESKSANYSIACVGVDGKSNKLGKILADEITNIMIGKKSGRIYQRKLSSGGDYYGVLRGANSVGTPYKILLEHGFHTNPENTKFLMNNENLKKLAVAESEIISDFFLINDLPNPYLVKINSSDGFVNIRKSPKFTNSDIVGRIENGPTKYTIIDEIVVDGVRFGKLKSGVGYIALSCTEKI